MKRRHLLIATSLTPLARALSAQPTALPESEHRPLRVHDENYPDSKIFEIDEPGTYVLTQDEVQRQLWGGGHSGRSGGFMVYIHCGSVTVDLQSRTLGADYGVSGFGLDARSNAAYARKDPQRYGAAWLDSRFVTLRNGTIDLARGTRTGLGVQFVDRWRQPEQQTGARGAAPAVSYYPPPPPPQDYTRNEYRFEHLTIKALSTAMAIEGSHTVIRHCVIESAGVAAIFIAGPHVLIEDCEIRLRPLARDAQEGTKRPLRAALILRDAQSAVIRNNRIRVDGGGEPAETHCILVRDGASDVTIEGNTFINVQGGPVTLRDGASASVQGNRSERRW